MRSSKSKLKDLEAKIAKLQAIYANEITESWTQGHQTQMMIDQYMEQLNRLKERMDDGKKAALQGTNKIYQLRSLTGVERVLELVDKNPDPANNQISNESPIGQKLLALKVGGKIAIGEIEYIIKGIS